MEEVYYFNFDSTGQAISISVRGYGNWTLVSKVEFDRLNNTRSDQGFFLENERQFPDYQQQFIFENQMRAEILTPYIFEDLDISLIEVNQQKQAFIFTRDRPDQAVLNLLIWVSDVTKTVTSLDIVQKGNNFLAVIAVQNIVPFSDQGATIEIIPIFKTDQNFYSVPQFTEKIELERYIACADNIKSSTSLVVVSCS